ncbi:male sterility protein-domain-containing protein [Aspergillus cavernicola]|uniref:Fatty acyl-CoA reductase n=1 Tax=Aspergillus cavernicola TaxID=176166 RepID=A0ABR4J354_9EURO
MVAQITAQQEQKRALDGLVPLDHVNWYREQVVFLTGGTGSLGSCLLYKLALQLPTARIYILCRGTANEAIQKWEACMPEQIDEILDSGKVHLIRGDMNQEGFGLSPEDVQRLQDEVTIVLHAAADISLAQSLPASIRTDALPVVRLARLAQSFTNITLLTHISSTFAQMHLPSGTIPEHIVKVDPINEPPPETQLTSILATGKSPYAHHFITPYAQAKYLAEQLLLTYTPHYPILIVRPSSISPALRDPFPLYGPDGAIPLHNFLAGAIVRGYDVAEIVNGLPQHYIFDEIPVDLVANITLLHMAVGTLGIVHAAAQLHIPMTIGELSARARSASPKEIVERIALNATGQRGVGGGLGQARNLPLDFHRLLMEEWRDWVFDCGRSEGIRGTTGPIGLAVEHDFEAVLRERVRRWSRQFVALMG